MFLKKSNSQNSHYRRKEAVGSKGGKGSRRAGRGGGETLSLEIHQAFPGTPSLVCLLSRQQSLPDHHFNPLSCHLLLTSATQKEDRGWRDDSGSEVLGSIPSTSWSSLTSVPGISRVFIFTLEHQACAGSVRIHADKIVIHLDT